MYLEEGNLEFESLAPSLKQLIKSMDILVMSRDIAEKLVEEMELLECNGYYDTEEKAQGKALWVLV